MNYSVTKDTNTLFHQITNTQNKLTLLRIKHWSHYEFLKPQWWLLVFVLLVPWFIWWKIVDRKRLQEIFLYGIMSSFVIIVLDAAGVELGLWGYAFKAIPLYNRCLAIDAGMLPVIFMIVYQCCKDWKKFILVHLTLAAIFAFVLEPFTKAIGITVYYHWKYIYSFPIYIILPICIRKFLGLLNRANGNLV